MANSKAQEILSDAIDGLESDEKELINWHLYDGYSNCQIAEMRGCEETKIRRQLRGVITKISAYCKQREGELQSAE